VARVVDMRRDVKDFAPANRLLCGAPGGVLAEEEFGLGIKRGDPAGFDCSTRKISQVRKAGTIESRITEDCDGVVNRGG
jgi:hypothetical protein